MFSEAAFSSCGKYRWWLRREICSNKRTLLFIGLNPSLATAVYNDATLKRLISFCSCWKYGKLLVINLFGIISKSPSFLRNCSDPVGEANDKVIMSLAHRWSLEKTWDLCLGWGNRGAYLHRNCKVISLLQPYVIQRRSSLGMESPLLSLGVTKNGNPRHPLYLSSKELLRPFKLTTKL